MVKIRTGSSWWPEHSNRQAQFLLDSSVFVLSGSTTLLLTGCGGSVVGPGGLGGVNQPVVLCSLQLSSRHTSTSAAH